MADEHFEARSRLQTAEATVPQQKPEPRLGRKLNRMAKRAEEIAEGLEHP